MSRPTPPQIRPAHSDSNPSRYGISGMIAPIANITNDEPAATHGDGFSRGSTPSSCTRWKFSARFSSRWISSVARGGGLRRHPHLLEHRNQFGPFGLRVLPEGPALDADLGVDLLVGGGDRRVLAQGHGERPGQQTGDAAEHDGLRAGAGRDTRDQCGVADQAVHRPECRGAQPAARHVGVPVVADMRQTGGRHRRLADSVMTSIQRQLVDTV